MAPPRRSIVHPLTQATVRPEGLRRPSARSGSLFRARCAAVVALRRQDLGHRVRPRSRANASMSSSVANFWKPGHEKVFKVTSRRWRNVTRSARPALGGTDVPSDGQWHWADSHPWPTADAALSAGLAHAVKSAKATAGCGTASGSSYTMKPFLARAASASEAGRLDQPRVPPKLYTYKIFYTMDRVSHGRDNWCATGGTTSSTILPSLVVHRGR